MVARIRGLPGCRDPTGDSCIVNPSQGSIPADRDIPHLHSSLLLAGLLLEALRPGLVVDGDQGSSRVDVVVGPGHSITIPEQESGAFLIPLLPGLLTGNIVLLLVISDLVLKVVLSWAVGILRRFDN